LLTIYIRQSTHRIVIVFMKEQRLLKINTNNNAIVKKAQLIELTFIKADAPSSSK